MVPVWRDMPGTAATLREEACFETGIKFGSLYHQFVGTPVSLETADSLATAIEAAIENQPACREVTVEIHEERLKAALGNAAEGYVEFTGRFATVEVTVEHEGVTVVAEMALEEGYPRMRVRKVRG